MTPAIFEVCRAAIVEALAEYGDEKATADVLARAALVPYDGDDAKYAEAVANEARTVWQEKLDAATARVKRLEFEVVAMKAMNLLRPSNTVH